MTAPLNSLPPNVTLSSLVHHKRSASSSSPASKMHSSQEQGAGAVNASGSMPSSDPLTASGQESLLLQGPEHDHSAIGIKVLPVAYALSLLSQLFPIPLHVFDSNGHYLKKLDNGDDDNWNVLYTDIAYRKSLIAEVKEQRLTLFTSERPVLLGGVALADNLILLMGPVVTSQVDSNFTKLFAAKHQAYNVALQLCTPAKLASMLLLINAPSLEKRSL